jgi:hypothetical protein
MFINSKEEAHVQLPKHKLIMARFKQVDWWSGFPDTSGYRGYKNS